MPIYEYYCKQCADEFEKLVLRESEEVSCPSCGSNEVERKVSAFSVGGGGGLGSLGSISSGGGCSSGGGFS